MRREPEETTAVEGYVARPASPDDRVGLLRLFEASHSACHCRYWHFQGDKNEWLDRCASASHENHRELGDALDRGSVEARGVVATHATGEIVGWSKLSPAVTVPKIYEQRYYRALPCFQGDRDGVHVIGCVLVHPAHRRRGVATALLRAAVALAEALGARTVEALPRRTEWAASDEELFMGPLSVFTELGFEEVHQREPGLFTPSGPDPYPVLHKTIARRDG